ncbi:DUF2726 domain-containing protein [Aggregatibacter actinomycetemcomitans]|uniref:DUF2726 domain-containing protein n=1 Tax=Aggregatibacter actinomycetemcomitans TaxID=714 RepID=UPI00022BFC15|nr:DUF2726 domain-containing protein [Aggregatibacter actinomycetemcomitans]
MNNYVILTAICFSLIFIGFLILISKNKLKNENLVPTTLYQKRFVLTKSETIFYKNLRKVLPTDYVIFAQIPFSCLLKPKDKNNRALFWKINQKRVDFVVLDSNLNTLYIIELDDKSHKQKQLLDSNRDELFLNSGIPTYRFNSETENNITAIKEKLPH